MKKIIAYYFIFLLSFFSIISSGVIDSIDGFQYLSVARNIYYHGKPTAAREDDFATRKNLHIGSIKGQDGEYYSLTGLGFSLAFLPAVFAADVFYKIYNIEPARYFPLENDWLILLTAGFTNSFFGAVLAVIIFIYLSILKIKTKTAIFLSSISIVSTNLLVYTKHSMVHLMFTVFLMLCFLMIKLYSLRKNTVYLFLLGLCYGVLSITYNPTFVLTLPALVLYFLFLNYRNIKSKLSLLKVIIYPFITFIPFVLIYLWYENLRAMPGKDLSSVGYYASYATHAAIFPLSILIEGLHGQLFSPGRSIFIYSPLLLVLIIFWYKIKKNIFPELLAFIALALVYIFFYSIQYSVGGSDQGIQALWHGELSWGPRYLIPLIPLGMILVSFIYTRLSKISRYLIFYPLLIIGIYIQMLGVLIPYQTKLHGLDHKIFLNGTEYFSSLYSDFFPRFNPVLNMSKKIVKLPGQLKKAADNGQYNLRFYDGIDFPFPVGGERWRVIENKGFISFDNQKQNPIRELTLFLINHPIEPSSQSAKILLKLNNQNLASETTIKVNERKEIKVAIPEEILKEKNNDLQINAVYDTPMEIKFDLNQNYTVGRKQILALQALNINGNRQNLESIDVPYVSPLGPAMTGVDYKNWGGENKDPWKFWDLHTQTFERLPDIWWVRNLFYWDIPKNLIISLFILNLSVLIFSGYKLLNNLKKLKN